MAIQNKISIYLIIGMIIVIGNMVNQNSDVNYCNNHPTLSFNNCWEMINP